MLDNNEQRKICIKSPKCSELMENKFVKQKKANDNEAGTSAYSVQGF